MYLTKVWIGNKWWYLDTSRQYKFREGRIFRVKIGIISYKQSEKGEVLGTLQAHSKRHREVDG